MSDLCIGFVDFMGLATIGVIFVLLVRAWEK